jgi:putative transposase
MHVIQRGNDRKPCFFADSDRLVYLSLLEKRSAQFGCSIHAYVLMTNHVHMLLTPAESQSAALLMKHLGQEYVQYVNRTYGRTGSLWEGRFRSCIVDTEVYLMRCHRYIELNPVRAGMVRAPGHYGWSSFRANAWGHASTLITPHPSYLDLAGAMPDRYAAYERLFEDVLTNSQLKEIRDAANGGFVLGSDEFIERLEEEAGRSVSRRTVRGARGCGPTASQAE